MAARERRHERCEFSDGPDSADAFGDRVGHFRKPAGAGLGGVISFFFTDGIGGVIIAFWA